MKIRSIIVDYGGVIALRKKTTFKPIFPDHELWENASRGLVSEDILWNEVKKYLRKSQSEILDTLMLERRLNKPLVSFLSNLKNRDFKIGLINNGLYKPLLKAIDSWELDMIFDVVINSAKEKISKPDKRIFLLACKRLRVSPEECIYFDDKQEHVDAAATLGMKSFIYRDFKDFKLKVNDLI